LSIDCCSSRIEFIQFCTIDIENENKNFLFGKMGGEDLEVEGGPNGVELLVKDLDSGKL
jgi:hypothetical protein